MRLLFVFVFCLSNHLLTAQIFRAQEVHMGADIFLADYTGPKYVDVDGHPYIDNNYLPAKINTIEKTQFVRLNCVDNIIEVKSGNGKMLMLDFDKIDYEIKFSGGSRKNYRTRSYIDEDNKTNRSFFETVEENEDYHLYRKERKIFVRKQDVQGYAEKKPAKFLEIDDAYFITDFKTGSEVLLEIPRKKKKFIAFFDQKGKTIDKFIKKEKLDFKKQGDLIRMLQFLFSENQQKP